MHPDDDAIAALATAARSAGEAPVVVIERAVSAGAFADPVHGPGLLRAALLEPADRQRGSVHTPLKVARRLVGIAVEAHAAAVADRTGAEPAWSDVRVLDPAVGGGVFAIAAAEALAARGVAPAQAARCVRGVDVDPAAVVATRAGLAAWAGVAAASLDGIRCGDALADVDPEPVDLVVGNPPFQSQLAAATARSTEEAERLRLRLGDAVVRYVDTAAVFLVDAVARLRPDGVAALVAPLSILSAGDAAPIRQALTEAADLAGLWVATEPVFAAEVPTCAPVLVRRSAIRRPEVARWRGATFEDRPAAPAPDPGSTTWAPLLADLLAVPSVVLAGTSGAERVVGDVGRATAGFRDQYYGLRGAVIEATGPDDERPRLITSGLIDPAACRWGRAPARFDRRPWTAPVVDLDRLAASDPAVAAWGMALLVPKLVVATQTRVIEAAVDRTGSWWPSVPTIAVTAPAETLDHLLAVLLAPPVSAWAFGEAAGAALSSDALRLRASQLAAIPLPPPGTAWDAAASILADATKGADAVERADATEGADAIERADATTVSGLTVSASISRHVLEEVGALMCEAYGVGEDVLRWWMDRLPTRG